MKLVITYEGGSTWYHIGDVDGWSNFMIHLSRAGKTFCVSYD